MGFFMDGYGTWEPTVLSFGTPAMRFLKEIERMKEIRHFSYFHPVLD